MDITVDLPAEVAEQAEQLGITSLSGAFMIPTLAV